MYQPYVRPFRQINAPGSICTCIKPSTNFFHPLRCCDIGACTYAYYTLRLVMFFFPTGSYLIEPPPRRTTHGRRFRGKVCTARNLQSAAPVLPDVSWRSSCTIPTGQFSRRCSATSSSLGLSSRTTKYYILINPRGYVVQYIFPAARVCTMLSVFTRDRNDNTRSESVETTV